MIDPDPIPTHEPIPIPAPAPPVQAHQPPAWCQDDLDNASSENDFQQAAGYTDKDPNTATVARISMDKHNIFALRAVTHSQNFDEPCSYKEAMRSDSANEWQKGIEDEIQSIHENNTFKTIKCEDVPAGCKLIGSKPIFKLK
jgi:hypothetical protein